MTVKADSICDNKYRRPSQYNPPTVENFLREEVNDHFRTGSYQLLALQGENHRICAIRALKFLDHVDPIAFVCFPAISCQVSYHGCQGMQTNAFGFSRFDHGHILDEKMISDFVSGRTIPLDGLNGTFDIIHGVLLSFAFITIDDFLRP